MCECLSRKLNPRRFTGNVAGRRDRLPNDLPDSTVPELPEVEAAARALTRAALGKTIAAVRAIHPALKRKLTPANSRRAKGKRIRSIDRRGKHQLLGLDSGDTLVVHFRMNGDWEIGTTNDQLDRFARDRAG